MPHLSLPSEPPSRCSNAKGPAAPEHPSDRATPNAHRAETNSGGAAQGDASGASEVSPSAETGTLPQSIPMSKIAWNVYWKATIEREPDWTLRHFFRALADDIEIMEKCIPFARRYPDIAKSRPPLEAFAVAHNRARTPLRGSCVPFFRYPSPQSTSGTSAPQQPRSPQADKFPLLNHSGASKYWSMTMEQLRNTLIYQDTNILDISEGIRVRDQLRKEALQQAATLSKENEMLRKEAREWKDKYEKSEEERGQKNKLTKRVKQLEKKATESAAMHASQQAEIIQIRALADTRHERTEELTTKMAELQTVVSDIGDHNVKMLLTRVNPIRFRILLDYVQDEIAARARLDNWDAFRAGRTTEEVKARVRAITGGKLNDSTITHLCVRTRLRLAGNNAAHNAERSELKELVQSLRANRFVGEELYNYLYDTDIAHEELA